MAEHEPDVAIVDIRMPPTFTDEGLRAARRIKERWPATAILVLSQHVQASYAVELLSLGASGTGYLLKDRVADLAELAASVRRVGEGGSVLDPSVVEQLVDQRRTKDEPLERLSARERDVLAAMAEGLTNKGIAERLFIAEHTVEKHISNIFAALQLPAYGQRPPAGARRRHLPRRPLTTSPQESRPRRPRNGPLPLRTARHMMEGPREGAGGRGGTRPPG